MKTLNEKKIKEIKHRIKNYLLEEAIKTKQKKEHTNFFLTNSENSLNSARALFDLSTNKDYQEYTGNIGLKGFLWVINASYYSMFYMVRALLENEGIKIKTEKSIHSVTFDTLIYYFHLTGKLQKKLFEYYVEAQEEAAELLGQQKTEELLDDYSFEKNKRGTFTYNTGEFAMKNKAKTSLERAAKFNREIKKIIQT